MATMTGALPPAHPGPDGPPSDESPEPGYRLFEDLVLSGDPSKRPSTFSWQASVVGHAIGLALVIVIPILWPEAPPHIPA